MMVCQPSGSFLDNVVHFTIATTNPLRFIPETAPVEAKVFSDVCTVYENSPF
jgi:hypothetical protein